MFRQLQPNLPRYQQGNTELPNTGANTQFVGIHRQIHTPEFARQLAHATALLPKADLQSNPVSAAWLQWALEDLSSNFLPLRMSVPVSAKDSGLIHYQYQFRHRYAAQAGINELKARVTFNLKGEVTGLAVGMNDPGAIQSPTVFKLGNTGDQANHAVSARPIREAPVLRSRAHSPSLATNTPSSSMPAWILRDKDHANVLLPKARFTDARRALQEVLGHSGRPVLYLHDAQALDELQDNLAIESGHVKLTAGPFRKLLESGGALLLNVSGFSPQQLEAFNTLMEEQLWQGEKLAQPVRILCLCVEDTLEENRLSGAQISRTVLHDLRHHVFDPQPDPVMEPPLERYPAGTVVVDLEHDPQWSRRLFGAPALDERQQWRHLPGALDIEQFPSLLVLRNVPPADPSLMDQVLVWQQDGHHIRLENGLPAAETADRLASKQPADNPLAMLADRNAPVLTVNPSNIDEVLSSHYGVRDGKPIMHPSLLEQVRHAAVGGRRACIVVTGPLPPTHWHRLMLHPGEFEVAAAPGVEVPAHYARHVTSIDRPDRKPAAPLFSAPVNFMHCADPALVVERYLSQDNPTRLFITPAMRGDALIYSLRRGMVDESGFAAAGGRPAAVDNLRIDKHQLVQDLARGKTVVLQGLEKNSRLAADLSTLLHPPYGVRINNDWWHFGEGGGFTGKLVVLSTDEKLLDSHALSPAWPDPFNAEQRRAAVVDELDRQFPGQGREAIERRLDALTALHGILRAEGLISPDDPTVNFPSLQMLFRHLFAVAKDSGAEKAEDVDHVQVRLIRSLFKDVLIGNYVSSDTGGDAQYDYLKICLRILFPQEMNLMPPGSVDAARIQELLGRITHPKDVMDKPWAILNTFSLDVIKAIVGSDLSTVNRRNMCEEVGRKVLALLVSQAHLQGWTLPAGFTMGYPDARREQSPVAGKLDLYRRPPRMPRDQRNLGKAEKLFERGDAIFLKGPPGAGKTHQAGKLASGAIHAINIGDEGSQRFEDVLESWVRDPGPATLVIDEANLAREENLAMLKGVFGDRTLYVNGRVHSVPEQHKIIFTGNDDTLPGRTRQAVAAESIPTQRHKSILDAYLRSTFIDPLLDNVWQLLPRPQNIELKEYIASQTMDIHSRLHQAFPELDLSPRHLEEFTAQTLSLPVFIDTSHLAPQELAPWLAGMAMNTYANSMSSENREAVLVWLMHHLNTDRWYSLPATDLSRTTLAVTPGTQDLADKISWWLHTQDMRGMFNHKSETLGQRALLIEGPASRGKDATACEVLRVQNRHFIHVNADPGSLQHLLDVLNDAYDTGKVVVVSELNLLPSGILESALNALLTGHVDRPAAHGFAVIATINPGDYAGRKPLSSALKSRAQHIVLDDYKPEELVKIAKTLAGNLCRETGRGNIAWGVIDDAKVEQLAKMHLDLLAAMQGHPSEFRPGIRQLRGALEQMQREPGRSVTSAFEANYAYYRLRAKLAGDASRQAVPEQDNTDRLKRQLQRLMSLSFPHWLAQPVLEGMDESTHMFIVNTDTHVVRFDARRSLRELGSALLKELRGGLYRPDRVQAEAAPAGRSMQPVLDTSGVGTENSTGSIGRISQFAGSKIYLRTARVSLQNVMLTTRAEAALPNEGGTDDLTGIELDDLPVTVIAGERRVYLLAAGDTRPVNVQLDNLPGQGIHRDENGGWYTLAEGNATSIGKVSYRLRPWTEPFVVPGPLFSGLDLTANPRLQEHINTMLQQDDRHAVVNALDEFFRKADVFRYSDEDAEALNGTGSLRERMQRFLSEGKGVCFEFASTFAAVLEQAFGIPARLCGGYVNEGNDIPVDGHRWVEYLDQDGKWQIVDPTASPPASVNTAAAMDSDRHEALIFIYPYIDIDSTVANLMSPAKLGLVDWNVRREGESFNAFRGTLDVKRLIRGEAKIFRDAALGLVEEMKPIHIASLPPAPDIDSANRLLLLLHAPLMALRQRGVPLSFRNAEGSTVPLESINDLPMLFVQSMQDNGNLRHADGSVVVDADSGVYLQRLISQYHESLLSAKNIDTADEDSVKTCLFQALSRSVMSIDDFQDLLPITIDLQGRQWELTVADFSTWITTVEVLDDLRDKLFTLFDISNPHEMMRTVDRCIASSSFQLAWSVKELVFYLGITVAKRDQTTDVKAWASAHLEKLVEQKKELLTDDKDTLDSLEADLLEEWNMFSTEGKRFLVELMSSLGRKIETED